MLLIPKKGTLERLMLEKMMLGNPVSYHDFYGTGITEENIDQIAKNLQSGMFEAENDCDVEFDA